MLRYYRAARPATALKLRASSLLLSTHSGSNTRFYRTIPATDTTVSTAAASVNGPSLSGMPSEAPPQTYFEYLDRMWNAKWFGTVDEHTLAAATTHAAVSDPSWFAHAFTACQHALGMEAGVLIFLVGAATRLGTLFVSLYGERAGERMRLALPELKKPQEDFNRIYYNDLASAMEVQVAASELKSHRRAIFRKYNTSVWKCAASLAMAPVIMTGLYQVSALCENAAFDVGSSSFLWCGALTLPDPFMILPITTCAVTLLNFELSISKEIKKGWMKNIIWGARLGCLCIIPVFTSFRSGVCLYFIGMNVVGLLQPLLLRSVAFRRWFGFPAAEELTAVGPSATQSSHTPGSSVSATKLSPKQSGFNRATSLRERVAAAVNPTGPTQDVLQASMTLQFPYLSHLLSPQVDENEEIFAKARNKQSKADVGRRGPITSPSPSSPAASRYARGTNPLMRETPVRRQDGAGLDATATASSGPSRSTSYHGEVSHHRTAASNVAGSAARSTPKSKGSSFASSGWKSSQLTFDESDFIPTYDDKDASSPPTKRR
ncbi:hypothetical protein ABB37_00699 [Leptomonas pyrrhocoris]|uniref:Uncharacterized protein n=1 Tax=Leptomonas pyrrhocoris TaxID=157538 RepID=A0A0M9GAY1_LEPPY|nr:hypothetical protein ABB37_00699 [Leptomonas pyrrhocoris]KPA86563.1 hypothetical protein ABB37_00699 [Leptomonas pyrrhocoris]|eukprot:XP_015665002.1 hypothetical protein ABB37_00699 [Leptomonas pyrrhocoris]